MKSSNLYRILTEEKTLQSIKEIDFSSIGLKERYDIQEWVEQTPSVLGEELLIIAKELTYFDATRSRPDLVAIDKSGNIVIIELKRDESGIDQEWQAIKYASFLSQFRKEDILHVFAEYFGNKENNSDNEITDEVAEQKILDFIDESNLDNLNNNQRIILASHRYTKEVISAVYWLLKNYNANIKCIQLVPYYDSDKESYYLQSHTILPVPGIEKYIVKPYSRKDIDIDARRSLRQTDKITNFFKEKLYIALRKKIDVDLLPTKTSRWAGTLEIFRYYHYWYDEGLWDNWELSYKVWRFEENYKIKKFQDNFRISFHFNKKYLLNNGVTEKTLDKIIEFMKSVKINEFKFGVDGEGIYLELYLKNDNFSDKCAELIADKLTLLISSTKKKIDEIIAAS